MLIRLILFYYQNWGQNGTIYAAIIVARHGTANGWGYVVDVWEWFIAQESVKNWHGRKDIVPYAPTNGMVVSVFESSEQ